MKNRERVPLERHCSSYPARRPPNYRVANQLIHHERDIRNTGQPSGAKVAKKAQTTTATATTTTSADTPAHEYSISKSYIHSPNAEMSNIESHCHRRGKVAWLKQRRQGQAG
ncbi:hypothetical protein E2C01_045119 [Portunus trituberculatus]|uniref:Uncharacterized protein n=1 Tax=Portunus trituberculatus TaxID=210409 RepID=A0A5B7G466_PORTR|nr:hypothetical protein [Portunus trituberculatus]